MTVRYTVVDGEVLSELRGGVKRDYVPDPFGSTVALLDSSQNFTDTFSYWPYGESAGRTGTTPTPFQYVGIFGYYNDSSSKSYVRSRYLDTKAGRWIAPDRIGIRGGINLFRYSNANPMLFFDYNGHIPQAICKPGEMKRINEGIKNACSYVDKIIPGSGSRLDKNTVDCMKRWCQSVDKIVICGGYTPAHQCDDNKNACGEWVPGTDIIVLCPKNWAYYDFCEKLIGICGISGIILHEMAHSCGHTDRDKDRNGQNDAQDVARQCNKKCTFHLDPY